MGRKVCKPTRGDRPAGAQRLEAPASPAPALAARRRKLRVPIVAAAVFSLAGLVVLADWWHVIPADAPRTFVGRATCATCHTVQADSWQGSDHDLAMDRATPRTVLADFDDTQIELFGRVSRMFRRDDRFFIHTDGPDGEPADFEIKYVLGVRPLQQYMVELDRPADATADEIGRLQVLRISWDTNQKKWFYLPPPDVRDEPLDPGDPLHWTGVAQCWNTTCAECHSTNLRKNFDLATRSYHTTFSEIDVSCEACHGPGSTHVRLARSWSLFWDRKQGLGLPDLRTKGLPTQVETCANCHSRRAVVQDGFQPGARYLDHFHPTPLAAGVYHADGQIQDENYEFGSFVQSKMFHKGVRCSDCHDPHSTRVKFPDNRLCTSCHQHPAGKYDGERHHHHRPGSRGSSCVECHMPATTYMEVDPRRDHGFKVPRPDVSLRTGTPNACTGCHLKRATDRAPRLASLGAYAHWIAAARGGDAEVRSELQAIDQWATRAIAAWTGKAADPDSHFASALAAAWTHDLDSVPRLVGVAQDRQQPAIVRASILMQLAEFVDDSTRSSIRAAVDDALGDPQPQLRAAAVATVHSQLPDLRGLTLAQLETAAQNPDVRRSIRSLKPLLADPVRLVRVEAARVLAQQPPRLLGVLLSGPERRLLAAARDELIAGLELNSDRAQSHLAIGMLHEAGEDEARAEASYRKAMELEPWVLVPRRNLASLLDRRAERAELSLREQLVGERRADPRLPQDELFARHRPDLDGIATIHEEAEQLRREELRLLARRAEQLPRDPESRYQYGILLGYFNEMERAEAELRRACELDPGNPNPLFGLALLYEKMERGLDAIRVMDELTKLRPARGDYRELLESLRARFRGGTR